MVQEAKKFAINFLSEEQKSASDWFAGKGKDAEDQFADIPHETGENGSPLITGHVGVLECDLHEELLGGDHTIVVGRVTRVLLEEEVRAPLLFYGSAYRKMDMDGVLRLISTPCSNFTRSPLGFVSRGCIRSFRHAR